MRWQGLTAAALLLLAACSGRPSIPAGPRADVVVASFDFTESHLLAEIYAQALEDEGLVVRRALGLGQRELVLPAMQQDLVDVVPEYAGSALDIVAPTAAVDRTDVAAVVAALDGALARFGLAALAPARASNQNVIVVRADLADRHELRAVSDLAGLAEDLQIGGPPECPRRPRCLLGLAGRYGLEFEGFEPLAGAELVHRALVDGVIDVGVLFSTDAALTGGDLVVLEDDLALQPPDNVVPVVRSELRGDERVRIALEQVSARLTTQSLQFLSWRLTYGDTSVAAEARGWLVRRGLVGR